MNIFQSTEMLFSINCLLDSDHSHIRSTAQGTDQQHKPPDDSQQTKPSSQGWSPLEIRREGESHRPTSQSISHSPAGLCALNPRKFPMLLSITQPPNSLLSEYSTATHWLSFFHFLNKTVLPRPGIKRALDQKWKDFRSRLALSKDA